MRLRLLVILNSGAYNGAIRQLSLWMPSLDASVWETRIVFLRELGPLGEALRPDGATVAPGLFRWRLDPFGAIRLIVQAVAWRPHIVFSINERNAAILSRLVGALAGGRVIHAIHSSPEGGSLPWWDRATLGLADFFVAVSETQKELLGRLGIPEQKIAVVYNGVPDGDGVSTDKSEREEVVGVFIGVLRRDKRVDLLLEALARVKDRVPNLRLCIAGKGDHEEELRGKAQRLGISERVQWLGWCTEVGSVLRQADIFVLPSERGVETLSMAVLEAMAEGLPIISTDVGSMAEVVTPDVGILFSSGDMEALAEALAGMAQSRELRVRMGKAARRKQQELYSAQRMRREMVDLLRSVAENS